MIIDKNMAGHLAASITILMWGTTFIFTKILFINFTPMEILFYRFCICLVALTVVFPHRLKGTGLKQELMFAGAGLCGVTLYYLFETIALTYTLASNVGVIVSIAPFFTAILSRWFLKEEKLKPNFFAGFAIAITGIFLINFSGNVLLQLDPIGDLLAVAAAGVWSAYSILAKKISQFGYHTIQTTRRIFFYGILFMIPALFVLPFEWGLERFLQPANLFNILFLGLGASALGFVTWNTAVKLLGAVRTSVYIYIIPAIAVFASVIVLHERITWIAALGAAFAVAGLFISEGTIKSVIKRRKTGSS